MLPSRFQFLPTILLTTFIPGLLGSVALSWGLVNMYQSYRATEHELLGVRAVSSTYHAVTDLQLIRSQLATPAEGEVAEVARRLAALEADFFQDLDDPQVRHQAVVFGIGATLRALSTRSRMLFDKRQQTQNLQALLPDYSVLIEDFNDVLLTLLDRSGLILDPELPTYYLMHVGFRQLPAIAESVTSLHAWIGSTTTQHASPEQLWRVAQQRLLIIRHQLRSLQRDFAALSAADAQHPVEFALAVHGLNRELDALRSRCPALPCVDGDASTRAHLQLILSNTKLLLDAAVQAGTNRLELLLTQRHERYWRDMLYTLILGLAAFSATLFVSLHFSRKLHRSYEALKHQSETDALTGISNRRGMAASFERVVSQARREHQGLAFAMVDIDYFKNYNDSYGHQNGDTVLKAVAQCLRQALQRGGDYVFRYGGEEFCFFFAARSSTELAHVCQHLRTLLDELAIEHQSSRAARTVTVSIGATFTPSLTIEDVDMITSYADRLLYTAKAHGRHRCELGLVVQGILKPYADDESNGLGSHAQRLAA